METARAVWLAGLFALCTAFLQAVTAYIRRVWLLRSFPGPRSPSIWAGLLEDFKGLDHHRAVRRFCDQHGGVLALRILWLNYVIVTDPSVVAELLKSSDLDKSVAGCYWIFDFMTSPKGNHPNLFSSHTNAHWKLVRKAVAPAFNPQNIRRGFHQVVATCKEMSDLLASLGPDAVVDVDELAQRAALDSIGGVGFDHSFSAVKGYGAANDKDELIWWLKTGLLEMEHRWKDPVRPYLPWLFPDMPPAMRAVRKFQASMVQLMAAIKGRGLAWEASDTSVAAHLLRIRDPATGQPLSDEELLPEIGIFFIAGMETTGHTMAWALYLISQHPEVEARITAELDALGLLVTAERPQPRDMTYDDIGKLKYLTKAIKESQRMLPAAADGTIKICLHKDVRLSSGHVIPRAVPVWVPIYALHNCTHVWDRPDEYLPERWEQPEAEYATSTQPEPASTHSIPASMGASDTQAAPVSATPPASQDDDVSTLDHNKPPRRFLPFGDGVRSCVGQSLAKMAYTTILALMYSRFTFQLAEEMGGPEGVRKREVNILTLQPQGGMKMRCIPRSHSKAASQG